MAQYVVTADDRAWFGRCRRAWDLGARRPPGPRAGASPGCPSAPNGRSAKPWRCTTSRACGAGTARSSSPLVLAAYDRAARPGAPAPAGARTTRQWAAGDRPVHAVPGRGRHRRARARPGRCRTRTWPRPTGAAVRYRDRIALVLVDDDGRHWLRRAPGGGRVRRRRRVAARRARRARVLGVGGDRVGEHDGRRPVHRDPPRPAGVPAHARSRGPPSRRRARRTGSGARCCEMLDSRPRASSPTPEWSHCPRCAFRAPCIAMNRGDDPTRCSPRATAPAAPTSSRRAGSAASAGAWAAAPRHPALNTTCVSCRLCRWLTQVARGGVSGGDGGLADADAAVVRGTRWCTSTLEAGARERVLDDLGEPDVLEHAAGEHDRVEAVRPRRRRRRRRPRRGRWSRGTPPRARRSACPARARRPRAATSGAGSITTRVVDAHDRRDG